MGRPPGSKNDSFIMPWKPLKWKPVYDIMVALKCAGHSNIEIGQIVEYTPVQVGNVLRSPEARRRLDDFSSNFSKTADDTLKGRLEKIRQKAVERIETVVMDDERASEQPMRIAEFSMSLLKGLGTLNGENATKNETNNTLVISDAIAQKLFDGAALADHVKLLHNPK